VNASRKSAGPRRLGDPLSGCLEQIGNQDWCLTVDLRSFNDREKEVIYSFQSIVAVATAMKVFEVTLALLCKRSFSITLSNVSSFNESFKHG